MKETPAKTVNTTIRMPARIKSELRSMALKKDRSVNWIVNSLIKEGLQKL